MPNATVGGQKVYNAHATESAESLVELFALQSGVNNTGLVNSFASRIYPGTAADFENPQNVPGETVSYGLLTEVYSPISVITGVLLAMALLM